MRFTRHTSLIAAIVLAAATPALAQKSAPTAGKSMSVPIKEQSKSGETGSATITPEGNGTRVEITLTGAPASAQPAHIHDGSCANLDPKPKWPLANVVNGKSSTLVDAPMSDLSSGAHAINVHKSAADLKTYVACGDITMK